MKVVTSAKMKYLEALAYKEGSSEIDFMEESGSGIALVVHDYIEMHNLEHTIQMVCGKGNNAGDAYVAGIHLMHLDYDIIAYQLVHIDDCSQLCQDNYRRFLEEGGRVLQIDHPNNLYFPQKGLIIDGILGTGFSGQISDHYGIVIEKMNQSGLPIIAVDIPSGLDSTTGIAQADHRSVIATETAFLGLPKLGFFLNDGWDSVGKLRYVNFGLPENFVEESPTDYIMLTKEDVAPFLPKIKRSRHKYEAGHVVALAGSLEMPGAAILSTSAALHSGAGIVHLLHPHGMEVQLASSIPELIKIPYGNDAESFQKVLTTMNKASAVYVGPGLGREAKTFELLKQLIPVLNVPCVIDADALNFLATDEGRQISLPKQCILTPHRGEMDRLLNISERQTPITEDYLKRCAKFANDKNVVIVLKGGPTYIIPPEGLIYICPRGDPGMATAGSGDVLTGLIAGFLAQKLAPKHAALLGCYIHGTAGEFAAAELTSYCMTASDILYRFPEGFLLEEM
jgi:NAD(P)H-hydrate epimerase